MTRRRTLALSAATAVTAAAVFASGAAIGVGRSAEVPSPVQRVQRYYLEGPSAVYSGDAGGIGEVSPIVVSLPDGGDRSAVVTMSFAYRTHGDGPFITTLGVKHAGAKVAVQPSRLTLAPAPTTDTATVRALVPGLAPNETYKFFIGVNSVFGGPGGNAIRTHKVVVTIDVSES